MLEVGVKPKWAVIATEGGEVDATIGRLVSGGGAYNNVIGIGMGGYNAEVVKTLTVGHAQACSSRRAGKTSSCRGNGN
jgi:hypothetical protein